MWDQQSPACIGAEAAVWSGPGVNICNVYTLCSSVCILSKAYASIHSENSHASQSVSPIYPSFSLSAKGSSENLEREQAVQGVPGNSGCGQEVREWVCLPT